VVDEGVLRAMAVKESITGKEKGAVEKMLKEDCSSTGADHEARKELHLGKNGVTFRAKR
jgi:hypothetical protein